MPGEIDEQNDVHLYYSLVYMGVPLLKKRGGFRRRPGEEKKKKDKSILRFFGLWRGNWALGLFPLQKKREVSFLFALFHIFLPKHAVLCHLFCMVCTRQYYEILRRHWQT